jgi:hypothetical protein
MVNTHVSAHTDAQQQNLGITMPKVMERMRHQRHAPPAEIIPLFYAVGIGMALAASGTGSMVIYDGAALTSSIM